MLLDTQAEWETSSSADVLDRAIDAIKTQQQALRFTRFDADVAFQIGTQIRESLQREFKDSSALISVRLWNGLTLFQACYGAGVAPTNEDWARRKLNTVRTYGKSSFLVGRELVRKGRSIDSLGADFAAHGGAVPIFLEGAPSIAIGAVIVSGLKQWQDHDVVVRSMLTIIEGERHRTA